MCFRLGVQNIQWMLEELKGYQGKPQANTNVIYKSFRVRAALVFIAGTYA